MGVLAAEHLVYGCKGEPGDQAELSPSELMLTLAALDDNDRLYCKHYRGYREQRNRVPTLSIQKLKKQQWCSSDHTTGN